MCHSRDSIFVYWWDCFETFPFARHVDCWTTLIASAREVTRHNTISGSLHWRMRFAKAAALHRWKVNIYMWRRRTNQNHLFDAQQTQCLYFRWPYLPAENCSMPDGWGERRCGHPPQWMSCWVRLLHKFLSSAETKKWRNIKDCLWYCWQPAGTRRLYVDIVKKHTRSYW